MAAVPTAAEAAQFSQLYVFGDSLSDIGNFFAATGNQLPPPQLGYFQGRFTNGPLWVDYLAPQLGLTSDRQTNFAFPGATTGVRNTTDPRLPALQQQIAGFIQAAPQVDPNGLYVVWAGANDYTRGGGETNPAIPVGNLTSAIQALAGSGARNILVPNLPDLGQVPLFQGRGPEEAAAATALTVGPTGHNVLLSQAVSQLRSQLGPNVNLTLLDVGALFSDLVSNPSQFGFTNTEDACLFPSPLLSGLPQVPITICSNPNEYIFWDSLHPSTRTHQILADEAAEVLEATDVPEPGASAALVLIGALVVSTTVLKQKA
ncbi:MAG TPA: SGNH/GDSL hydrolase family protein [Trichocoleus sp.]